MRNLNFYTILAASAVMMLTGCSQSDIVESQSGKEAVVNFNVAAPNGMKTRAFGDGTTATKLHYAVYSKAGDLINEYGIKEADFENLSTTVSLKLVKGDTYTIVFWADAGNQSPYTIDWANKSMSIANATINANDENRDAFYNTQTITVAGNANESVQLKRPFAQLNIGTDDIAESTAAGFVPGQTQVTVSGVPNQLDLFTGNVSGSTNVTYQYAALPNGEDFPVTGYDYLSMNYVLVGADKSTTDVTLNYTDANGGAAHERTFASVPVQRNYRTNIYGSLLTNQVNYTVTIAPNFDEPANDVKIVEANTSAELSTAAKTAGNTVVLKTDGTYSMPTTVANGVTIVGNGEQTVLEAPGGQYASGAQNLTFKNLTVKESTANYNGIIHSDNLVYDNCVIEGMPFGYATHLTYNNCTFKQTSSSLYNLWTYASNATFNNCKFECAGKAALVYRENGTDWLKVTFNNCEFVASTAVNGKAAIEIDSSLAPFEVYINNCTATGFGTGNTSGLSLWNNKNATDATNAKLKVFVDGVQQTLKVK